MAILAGASASAVAADDPPSNVAPPSVTGSAVQGSTLSASTGTWSGSEPISYAYQWRRCSSYPAAVKADAPLGYWRLGEATGTTAADVSGSGNPGSYVAGVQLGAAGALAGDGDTAAGFDGVDDRVSIPDTAPLRLNGSFSIEFWAKLRAPANTYPGIIRKGNASSTGTGWYIYYNTTAFRPDFQRAGVSSRRTSTAGALSSTVYKHYVLTYDAGATTLRWYVGGALDATYTGVTFPTATDPSTVDLGRGTNYGNEFLDEVALYATALTPARISAHYSAGTLGCTDIAGASGATYTLTAADVGWSVRVRVTATNTAGSAAATSQPTTVVQPGAAPANTAPPTISGTARDGQTLTADKGTWTGTAPISYTYRWQRCAGGSCSDIAGATAQTYTLVAADVASTVRVQVTASNAAGSTTVPSAETAVVAAAPPANTALPSVSGPTHEGQTLTADKGAWTGTPPISYAYVWQRCSGGSCSIIPGATGQTYTLTTADVGSSVRVQVVASNSAGSTTATSAQTAVVQGAAALPTNTAPPSISGVPQQGRMLTADNGTWTGTPPISFAYRWRRCSSYAASVKADAPLAYWRLDEAAGTTAADASGNGNPGIYAAGVQLGAAGALADGNAAAGFDGVDDRVSIPDKAALRLNGSFTIEFWAKLRAPANTYPGIIRKGEASSSGNGWYIFYNTRDFRPSFKRAGVSGRRTSNAGALSTTTYKHYVMTYDAPASTLRWYVGGALDSTYKNVTFSTTTDTSTVDLGRGTDYGNEFLDDVALYGTALSAGRISAHYTAGIQACTDIAGATASTYTLTSADVGFSIRVLVTATNAAGSSTATSQPTATVYAADPSNATPPTIAGLAQQGETLSGSQGTWTGTQPISYAYQWRRCDSTGANCTDIFGATAQTYTLGSADVGSTVRLAVTASNSVSSTTAASAQTAVVEGTAGDPIFIGAGDIADVPNGTAGGDEATAKLLDAVVSANPGRVTVFAAGDNAYEDGTAAEYTDYYDPTWGRHKAITKPVPGNHEYQTPFATGYFGYFGAAAGDPAKGYYTYNLGSWRIYALNSSVEHGEGSEEEQWLRNDLAANSAVNCVLAYFHHPRWASGTIHGSDPSMQAFWQALYDYGADVVIAGHEHSYQRFAPLNATGGLDSVNGIREFVVGTGGKSHYNFPAPIAGVEAYNYTSFGVLALTLHQGSYSFQFMPEAGSPFTDSGSGTCHSQPTTGTLSTDTQATPPPHHSAHLHSARTRD
jgi:acid phosphatase type 7